MMLRVDDFPLKAIGTLIYARNWSSPVLTASDPGIAFQITEALNKAAREERPLEIGKPWLVIQ